MYRVNVSRDDLKRLKDGDKDTLIRILEEQNVKIIEDLKKPNLDNGPFLQGASFVTDSLLNKLRY